MSIISVDVTNIDNSVTQETFEKLFQHYHPTVVKLHHPHQKFFVRVSSPSEATRIITEVNGKEMGGVKISVTLSKKAPNIIRVSGFAHDKKVSDVKRLLKNYNFKTVKLCKTKNSTMAKAEIIVKKREIALKIVEEMDKKKIGESEITVKLDDKKEKQKIAKKEKKEKYQKKFIRKEKGEKKDKKDATQTMKSQTTQKCFICGRGGHIASKCPEKKHGGDKKVENKGNNEKKKFGVKKNEKQSVKRTLTTKKFGAKKQ
ncbi:hypothetical protein EIN_437820 [Entamoeba invadens IP1]|uniref:CCHC-type domain-containing protein n=1 Tax=Entamoeba invadens IP1 TaxID=370355 RepID=A0A0A1U3L0_ENTIV|nr:hypothetical protein EIN_437820 [Entamoeba invadens IP1]ELP88792.1 hypothetical protein EIN_437820 [Entamoeba invadens IP1]|eukprot:XP_004255563.1 hypothetical protein EIN_437820 [Entamoeba invadens IP1]